MKKVMDTGKIFLLLLVFISTEGYYINFTIIPEEVVPGAKEALTMKCVVNDTDIAIMYNLKIKRETLPGSRSYELLASFVHEQALLNENLKNIKDFNVSGSISINSPYLEITKDITKLVCSDARSYICEAVYDSANHQTKIPRTNATFKFCANKGNNDASFWLSLGFQTAVISFVVTIFI